ncbi:MAG: aromatic ring-hydroxylating dioxygenase subunit alpha [Planctomycetota bacterium]|nr:aromatic ring-hydroxylating dioxygenase subunit alpha [Planctomycetota bacterium]
MEQSELQTLISSRRQGWSMPQPFYTDPAIHLVDVQRIFRRHWIFVGHSCQIKEPGEFFTVAIGEDSLILIRGDDDQVRALHNVCRHRGTLISRQECGTARRLVCPYHQWSYERDGRLASCRGMHEEIDRESLGLLPVHIEDLEGMLFVCLADTPPDFTPARQAMSPVLQPQRMGEAKVAKIVDYDVAANWKLVWENNRECYHCNVNHPQYTKANFDHFNSDDTTARIQGRIDAATERHMVQCEKHGFEVTHRDTGMANFPDQGQWFSANRTTLVDGYVSETMDGQQVAPLMGDYTEADVGTMRCRTVPNMWNHSSCDHVVSTRLLPTGPNRTQVRVIWLVHPDAEEGRDYHLDKLMPFWQLTSEQDWELCEFAQTGISSSAYRPGPYSTHKEYNVDAFVRWYLDAVAQ